MDFEQLEAFLVVADQGNFTRAAAQLSVSQPALSRSIQRMETELGQPLFERKSRSVALTGAGELFQSRAQQILSLFQDTKAEISDDGQVGRLRIGAIPTIAPFFLPDLLRDFAADHPKAHLVVQEDTTDNLLKRCKQGEIDIAVLALPIPARYLEIEELATEELLLVMSKEHPLASKKRISLTDLESLPFVMLDEAHCLSDNIVSFCRQRAMQPVSIERASQLQMVQELVSLHHGISMIPEMARRLDRSNERVYRSIMGKPTRTIAAIWNPSRFQSQLLVAFRKRLRRYAKQSAKMCRARS